MRKRHILVSAPNMELTHLGGRRWRLVMATPTQSITTEFKFDKTFDWKGSAA